MRIIGTGLFCLLSLIACSKQDQQLADDKEKLDWDRLKRLQFYWEGDRITQLEGLSTVLQKMSEPVYWNVSTNALPSDFYRFLCLRTFDGPVVIAISPINDDRVEVRSKVFSGQAGQIEQKTLVTNRTNEMGAFMDELDRWLPYVPEFDGIHGADGATWMIEGVKNGKYYMAQRWSPEDGWVREMGLRFLKEANIEQQ